MEKERLKSAMNMILLLLLIIILQHVANLLHSPASITMPLNFVVIPVVAVYFLQLHRIFSFYFEIDNLLPQLITIAVCYLFLFVVTAIFQVSNHGTKDIIPDNELLNRIALGVLICVSLIMQIILIVMNFILGSKLIKKATMPGIKNLGRSFYGAGSYYLLMMILSLTLTLIRYHHLFILFELLPYLLTYRIYSRILRSEIQKEVLAKDPFAEEVDTLI